MEQTINERVEHLEKTLPNLSRLREQEVLFEKVKVLEKSMNDSVIDQSKLQGKLDSVYEDHKHLQDFQAVDHDALVNAIAQIHGSCESSIVEMKKEFMPLKKSLNDLESSHDALNAKLKDVKLSIDSHPQIMKANVECAFLIEAIKEIRSVVDIVSQRCDLQSSNHINLNMVVKELQKENEALRFDVEELKRVIVQVHKDLVKGDEQARASFMAAQNQFAEEVNSRFSKLPLPFTVNLDSVKDDFAKQLQPVSFDAKNANLRSSNNEAKIMLLEKKVEQLFLFKSQADLRG